jgi:hypothetical protein
MDHDHLRVTGPPSRAAHRDALLDQLRQDLRRDLLVQVVIARHLDALVTRVLHARALRGGVTPIDGRT